MSLKEAINNEIIDSKASDADLREQAWRTVWSAIIRDRFGLVREQDARNVSMALDDLLELGEIDDKAAAIELLSAEAGRMVRFRIDQLVHEGVDEQRKNAMNTYRTFQNFAEDGMVAASLVAGVQNPRPWFRRAAVDVKRKVQIDLR